MTRRSLWHYNWSRYRVWFPEFLERCRGKSYPRIKKQDQERDSHDLLNSLHYWLFFVTTAVGGLSNHDITVVNNTGIYIARLEIDSIKKVEEIPPGTKILVSIDPHKHHLRLVFRGGADVNWPKFDFSKVHQITFERHQNHFSAHVQ